MAEPFPISGSIDPRAFPFLLMDLHRNGATGSLKVEGPSYQKALYFRGGRILFGSSNDPRDQLGAILIENGKITPEQLEEVNNKVGPGSPLAKVLAETGFVTQRELSEAARAKVERILSDVIAYTSGNFEFEDGVLPKGAVDLKLATERLILAAVRRVADPEFVNRHLSSLDVVLVPASSGTTPVEMQSESGGLLEQLHGRCTLREAATAAGLDPSEAGRVACGLIFLGLVELAKEKVDAAPAFMPADDDDELDLGQTARMAFASEPGTVPMAPALVEPEPEEPFFLPDSAVSAAKPDTEPGMRPLSFDMVSEPDPPTTEIDMVAPSSPPATGFETPPPPLVAPPPVAARPWIPEPEREPPPMVAVPQPLPLVQPPRPHSQPAAPDLNDMMPQVQARPSREDLAALDALLNTPPADESATPLDEPPEERWDQEPRLAAPPRPEPVPYAPRPYTRNVSRAPLVVAIAATTAAALALGALAWRYLGSAKPDPRTATASPIVPPTLATPLPPVTPRPDASPTAVVDPVVPASGAGTTLPPAPANTAPAARATPAPMPTAPADVLDSARSSMQAGRLSDAASGFVASLRKAPAGTATVQLLVACSGETVQKAVDNVGSAEMFIVPVSFKGRDCYRVCWGLYESEARAASAARSVPDYFRRGGASPRVVSASQMLP